AETGRTGQEVVADDGDEEDGGDRRRELGVAGHAEVPPVEAPGGSLWLTFDAIGDDVEESVGGDRRAVGEPRVKKAFDVAWLGHAVWPSLTAVGASASRAARMARCAWWSRERAVPAGMPSVSAISDGW